MGALIEVNTDGLAKFAEIVGGWLGWNARAIELNAEAVTIYKGETYDLNSNIKKA